MNLNEIIQPVEIYLDYATIPSLNYFLHFAENSDDQQTIRLFGLARFTIPQSLIDTYPSGIIRYVEIKNQDQHPFNQLFEQLLQQTPRLLSLTFHLNLFHWQQMWLPLLTICLANKDKIANIQLHFYDDGSEGLVSLYQIQQQFSAPELQRVISDHQQKLSYYPETRELQQISLLVIKYLWGELYPTCYHLLNTEYLESATNLQPLKDNQVFHYQLIDFNRYLTLSEEQKAVIFSILDISSHAIERFQQLIVNHQVFLFIGTTLFNVDTDSVYKLHQAALKQYTDKNSPYYAGDDVIFLYKGHPHAKEVNQRLAEQFPEIAHLPDYIPMEIFYLFGFRPQKTGGFASTNYFFAPKQSIQQVIFITEEGKQELNYTFEMQYILAKAMVELGYLKPEQVVYYLNLFN